MFFSCKSDVSAYEPYTVPVDWHAVLKDSTWVVQGSTFSSLNIEKLVFLDNGNDSWTCRLETSFTQDECSVTMNGDRGSLVYGQVTFNVHLAETDGTYIMRLTAPDNSAADLVLVK